MLFETKGLRVFVYTEATRADGLGKFSALRNPEDNVPEFTYGDNTHRLTNRGQMANSKSSALGFTE